MRKWLFLMSAFASQPTFADFPLNQRQSVQAEELFAGLHGHFQQGTEFRLVHVAWLYKGQSADPIPVTVTMAKKLVAGCVHTISLQVQLESEDYLITCAGKNKGILFRYSDGDLVVGVIENPPPIFIVPNPEDVKK